MVGYAHGGKHSTAHINWHRKVWPHNVRRRNQTANKPAEYWMTFCRHLGRAAEGAAVDKDLSAGMLKDLRSEAKDLSLVAAKDPR